MFSVGSFPSKCQSRLGLVGTGDLPVVGTPHFLSGFLLIPALCALYGSGPEVWGLPKSPAVLAFLAHLEGSF